MCERHCRRLESIWSLSVLICGHPWSIWGFGFVRVVGGEAEAAPGFCYDDAVGGVVEVVADLDGEVGADVADVAGEGGDVLGAFVGDAGDAVVVHEEAGCVGGVVGCEGGVGDGAVGDAAHSGEEVAAGAFDLFGGGARAADDVPDQAQQGCGADGEGGDSSRGAESERQMDWKMWKHRSLAKG